MISGPGNKLKSISSTITEKKTSPQSLFGTREFSQKKNKTNKRIWEEDKLLKGTKTHIFKPYATIETYIT